MAGEIEEPFRLNFQADLLHSGSISFGRFESESLSWERRSIFSHNRYLEEVEKCSKPGTVTEKKAYFEAEFKRKALLKQRASDCQDGGDSPSSRNTDLRDFEESGDCNKSTCSSGPSVCTRETGIQHYGKKDVEAFYSEYGNGTRNSEYDEDTTSQECEIQNCEFLLVVKQDEPVIDIVDCTVGIPEHLKFDETHQSETEDVVAIAKQSIAETLTKKVILLDVSTAKDSSLVSQTLKKVKPASEKKLTRSTPKTQANVDRFQKHSSYEASRGSMKPRTTESELLPLKKTEKKSPRPASPFTSSRDAKSIKEKELRLKKSIAKDIRSDKTVNTKFPLSEKSLPGVCSTANRPKQTISSSKAHVIQSPAGYSLKTDQRTESRKELYMKFAEKTHAKEVKTNQVKEKTLEKQAAQIKQFRRSLNFKATPMPSFYNEATRGSDQHKVSPISKTLNQPRPSSQSVATRRPSSSNIGPSSSTASSNKIRVSDSVKRNHIPENTALKSSVPSNIRRPSSSYSSANRTHLSDSDRRSHIPSKNALHSSKPSNIRPSSATASTNRICLSESVRRNHIPVKREYEKKKDTSLTKQKDPVPRLVKKHVTGIHTGTGLKSGDLLVC